jgi:hypothetical protein
MRRRDSERPLGKEEPVLKLLSIAVWFAVASVWAQLQPDTPQLTARELFYASAEAPVVRAKPSEPGESSRKAAVPKSQQAPPRTQNPKSPAAAGEAAEEGSHSAPKSKEPSGAAPNVPVSDEPLGIRYCVLKLIDNSMTEVSPDSVFHTGDRIRVKVEVNSSGYLYVVHQGSKGTWQVVFPAAETGTGDNRVDSSHPCLLPPKGRLVFDDHPGVEVLFVVFSRQPAEDLDSLMYSLRDGAGSPTKTLVASAEIGNTTVNQLRNVYARDLVVEKVDGQATAAESGQEKAVYVVNPKGGAESRVVADIRLKHE